MYIRTIPCPLSVKPFDALGHLFILDIVLVEWIVQPRFRIYLTNYKASSGIEQLHLGQALSSYLAYDVQLSATLHAVVACI